MIYLKIALEICSVFLIVILTTAFASSVNSIVRARNAQRNSTAAFNEALDKMLSKGEYEKVCKIIEFMIKLNKR